MLGWVTVGESRKAVLHRAQLMGLPLWKLELPACGRSWERRVNKGLRLFAQQRVTRVLTASDFPHWPMLLTQGFRPVDTCSLRCALAPLWVESMLQDQGRAPRNAALRLMGERVGPDLKQVARNLCPLVRSLVINAPGGEILAAALRREFGLPVLPGGWAADLTLRFEDGPLLSGVEFGVKGACLPPDCDALPLLSVLWQCGRVPLEEITLQIHEITCFP